MAAAAVGSVGAACSPDGDGAGSALQLKMSKVEAVLTVKEAVKGGTSFVVLATVRLPLVDEVLYYHIIYICIRSIHIKESRNMVWCWCWARFSWNKRDIRILRIYILYMRSISKSRRTRRGVGVGQRFLERREVYIYAAI